MEARICRECRGYTLFELMFGLLLTALLVSWAAPGLHNLMQQSRMTAANNHFLALLEQSRYRALALRVPVTICTSLDAQHCNRNQGEHVLVFEDANENGFVDEHETLVAKDHLFEGGDFWLVWRAFRQTDYLRWAVGGRTDSMNGTYTLCNKAHRDDWLRQIVINRAGRSRVTRPARNGESMILAARKACAT